MSQSKEDITLHEMSFLLCGNVKRYVWWLACPSG